MDLEGLQAAFIEGAIATEHGPLLQCPGVVGLKMIFDTFFSGKPRLTKVHLVSQAGLEP